MSVELNSDSKTSLVLGLVNKETMSLAFVGCTVTSHHYTPFTDRTVLEPFI